MVRDGAGLGTKKTQINNIYNNLDFNVSGQYFICLALSWTLDLWRPDSLWLLLVSLCCVSLFTELILKLISVTLLMPVFCATCEECTVCSALISAEQKIKTNLSCAVRKGPTLNDSQLDSFDKLKYFLVVA